MKVNSDAKVLVAPLAPKLDNSFQNPSGWSLLLCDTPAASPLSHNVLYMSLPSNLPGSDGRWLEGIKRCKPCASPDDSSDMLKYLTAGQTGTRLTTFTTSCLRTISQDDAGALLKSLEVEMILGHQSVRGRDGVIAVLCMTH